MVDLETPRPAAAPRTHVRRSTLRWLVTFIGFPLGGLTAKLLVGPVDSPAPAIVGGLITGAILGAVQAWGLARRGRSAAHWTAATAVGLAGGLGLGAATVGYATNLGSLAVQGAVCGAVVGTAQAYLLRDRLGTIALVWPALLSAIWALGWTVTTTAGIQVNERFTVFGSSGAIVATVLTAMLPALLAGRRTDG